MQLLRLSQSLSATSKAILKGCLMSASWSFTMLLERRVVEECHALAHSHFDWCLMSRLGDVEWQLLGRGILQCVVMLWRCVGVFARRHAISSVLKAQLQCDKLRCNLSAWLQPVSSAASCQGSRDFSSSAQLQTVSLAATVPTQCAFVNSAAHTQPSCNLP